MNQITVWEKFGIKVDQTSEGNVKAYFMVNDAYRPSVTVLGTSRNSIAVAVKIARHERNGYLYLIKVRESYNQ